MNEQLSNILQTEGFCEIAGAEFRPEELFEVIRELNLGWGDVDYILRNKEDNSYFILLTKDDKLLEVEEREEEQINNVPVDLGVGDVFVEDFTTTSPPARVLRKYCITRREGDDVFGVLWFGDCEEMSLAEM